MEGIRALHSVFLLKLAQLADTVGRCQMERTYMAGRHS